MAEVISLGSGDTLGNSGAVGKVGVGTTAPVRVLQVTTTSGNNLRLAAGSTKSFDLEEFSSGIARITSVSGNLEIRRAASSSVVIQDANGNAQVTVDGYGNLQVASSAWNGGHLILGNYHLWIDGNGSLRILDHAPTGDSNGVAVGSQS